MSHFANRVPKGEYWELHSPVEASVGVSGEQIKQARAGLIGWITANAATLPVTRFGDRYPYSTATPLAPAVPFPFALYRWSVPDCGFQRAFGDANLYWATWRKRGEHGSKECVMANSQSVLDGKRDEGARTVLVMEENDLSSTNHQLVAEAMARAEAGRRDTPDEIFLVSTVRPNPWWVTCLRRDGANYYDDGERFHDLDPSTLTQLTKR